ncbi:MAG: universal stress protein [Chitinophagales bacterium]|nr:universal stress protein [Chitinophagales bacterium]
MYKILFLTDFSEYSQNARTFTKLLAKTSNSEVVVMHTISPVVGSITQMGFTVELNSVLYDVAQQSMIEIEEDFKADGIKVSYTIRSGNLLDEAQNIIDSKEANLIIMGTHGKTGILDKMIGSSAAQVITQMDVPTIVIPYKYKFHQVKNITFAHQLESPKLEHLAETFKILDFFKIEQLNIVHIYSQEQDVYQADTNVVDKIKEQFPSRTINFHFVNDDSVINGLYNFLKDHHTDLLVTSSNKKTFWKRLISGNISATLATEFDIPIYILKDHVS